MVEKSLHLEYNGHLIGKLNIVHCVKLNLQNLAAFMCDNTQIMLFWHENVMNYDAWQAPTLKCTAIISR